jgi:hypothetical protein
MRAEFEIVRTERDRIQSMVAAIEREKMELVAQLAKVNNQKTQNFQSSITIDQTGQLDSIR